VPTFPSIRDLRDGAEDDDILHHASAIAFQVFWAAIPLALVMLAALGFLNMQDVWTDAATDLRPNVSTAAFQVIDDTVRNVLEKKQYFWLTLGLALALWRLSAAMRAVMHALDGIYGADRERTTIERMRVSVVLAIVMALLLILAIMEVHLGALLVKTDGVVTVLWTIVRWGIAAALALIAVGITIRHAPATRQPWGWVGVGALLCVGTWLLASVAFGFYATEIASYGSLFGSFASLFILITYLYLTALALLAGAEADAQVRRENEGTANGS
jgi:membrane protein